MSTTHRRTTHRRTTHGQTTHGQTTHGPRRHRRGHVLAVGLAVGVLLALAGCSAGSESSDAGGGTSAEAPGALSGDAERGFADSDGGADGGADGGVAEGTTQDEASGDGSGGVNRPFVQTRAVIRTGEVALVTRAMNQARGEIEALLGRHGGYLASEDTRNDRAGRPERSVLVLRVPEPAFDIVMGALAGIGRTERADRSSEDVTTKVIDVDTRVRTQEASLARLQRFLRQAVDIDDMIRLESEIASRQAALESLKAQQEYLSDQTAMSTVTVRLRTPATPPQVEEEDGDAGFLAGLSNGWTALKAVLVGAATVAGALLPFVVAIALVGVPTWLLARAVARRRPRGVPAVASGPAADPDA